MSGQRKALIIANDTYEHEELRNLLAPAADAKALEGVLGDPQIGDFAVQIVHNEPAHVIQAHIEELFSESRSDDVLLVHFSGHGLKSESGELFFAASNTRLNRLRATTVPAVFVERCMEDSRSRTVVLLLDCCYGGAFGAGVKVRGAGDINVLDSFPRGKSGGRSRAVITASNAMEYAFEGDRLGDQRRGRPSVFTSALVEGLATGNADRDGDGWVSLDELYDYVFDKVREQNPHQTPTRRVDLAGELYLARSQRRGIQPAPSRAVGQATPGPVREAWLDAELPDIGVHNRGWHLAAFLLPFSLSGAFAVPFLLYKRDRAVRMNVMLSLEICLAAAPGIISGILANRFAQEHSSVVLYAALWAVAVVLCAPFVAILIYCIFQVRKYRQPEVPWFTRGARQLTAILWPARPRI
jgi:hypothetical protein